MQRQFTDREAAFAFLGSEFLPDLQRVFEDSEGRALVELFYQEFTTERLIKRFAPTEDSPRRGLGYGAYVSDHGVIFNLQKAALLTAALLTDVALTSGFASLLLSQVLENPVFIRSLAREQHLACLVGHEDWRTLSIEDFRLRLVEGRCRHPGFTCSFQDIDGKCRLNRDDLLRSRDNLLAFHRLGKTT